MPQTEKQIIGALGESLAEKHLKSLGFSILTKNYRQPWGEIDIVARKKSFIHFIEVKTVTREGDYVTRATSDNYEPEDNIHPWKLKRLYRAINSYLMEKKLDEDEIDWQLDAVSVYLEKGSNNVLKIEYLPDIL
jgi:putative endonuclease